MYSKIKTRGESSKKYILELRNLTVSCLFIFEVIPFVHDNYLIQTHQRNYLTKNHNTSPYIPHCSKLFESILYNAGLVFPLKTTLRYLNKITPNYKKN